MADTPEFIQIKNRIGSGHMIIPTKRIIAVNSDSLSNYVLVKVGRTQEPKLFHTDDSISLIFDKMKGLEP